MSTPALPGGFVMDGAPQTQTGNDLPPGFVEDNPSAQPQTQDAQPQPAAPPQPTMLDTVANLGKQAASAAADAAENFGIGVAKGAGQTVNTISKGISKVAPSLVRPTDVAGVEQMEQPQGLAQGAGVGAESIAEMMLGDEALKAASIGDKLLQVGKVADYYERATPFVKRAIEAGLNAAHAGANTAAEEYAKTGSPKQAAEAGAVGAVAAPVVNAVTSPVQTAKAIWSSATGKAIQDELKGGIRNVINDVASDAQVKQPVGSLRTSVEQVASGVENKAKGLFQQIDDATDNQWTNVQQKMRNAQMKLREITGTDPSGEEKLEEQLTYLRSQADDLLEQAKKVGVDPAVADRAKAAWRQKSALEDVDTAIKRSIFGNSKNMPETITNPRELANRVQKLEDNGRLAEAMGDKADAFMKAVYDGAKAAASHYRSLAAAKALAYGAGAYELGHGLGILGH